MNRRNVLRTFATLPAAGLLRAQQPAVPPKPNAVAIEQIPVIEATVPDAAGSTLPTYFSAARFAALVRFSDAVVPAMNGVPGALEAHAPEFLDFLVSQSSGVQQEVYDRGLDELNSRAQAHFEKPFAEMNKGQVDTILAPLRDIWSAKPDQFTMFLRTAKQDILQATQNSKEWIHAMSKRIRSAGGLGTYWFPIE